MLLALSSHWRLAEVVVLAVAGLALLVASLSMVLRQRRGPEPLSRLLLAGSLGEMQRPRRLHRGGEP